MKNYDVWFNLGYPANIVVEANSEEEARDTAEDLLVDMDQDELLERINSAIDFGGIKIVSVEEVL